MIDYGPGNEPKYKKESLWREIQWRNVPSALLKVAKDIPGTSRGISKAVRDSSTERREWKEKQQKAKENSPQKPDDGISISGWIGLCVIVVIAALCFGAYHGWDRHSYSIPVPHLSGPSDDDVIHALASDGISGAEVVDRWDDVHSDGRDGVRTGTTLYPLRVSHGGETMEFYFYYDDFGRLRFYPKQ
jgi:hypothetical protein